jgi:gluconolactonase
MMNRYLSILKKGVFISVLLGSVNVWAQEAGSLINPEVWYTIFPKEESVKLIVDGSKQPAQNSTTLPGLSFTEGPTWLNGKLYFTNLGFKLDNKSSYIVEMDPDGTYRYISKEEMNANGTMSLGNGNLAVCDMFGHRIIEMTTAGKVVRVITDKLTDGTRLDGPNDLVVDSKGGIYFSDPQYTPGIELKQPTKAVYYMRPDGATSKIIGGDEICFPNGVLLSPDGKTLYVANTQNDRQMQSTAENFVMSYPVNEDGSIGKGRRFAQLMLSTRNIQSGSKTAQADGMTMDVNGNIYVTSQLGIQVFDSRGNMIGILRVPVMPVNCCFGGSDFQTLFMTCSGRIYAIHTNVKGLQYPLK